MITVSISGRKATLLKTADLPTGNDNSIKVNFIFSATDPVWKGATKVAIFVAITPRGLRKTLPAVIDSDGECFIPGKILSTPFSKISVGAMATYEDGSSVASNLVFVNSTDAGAGGDNIYDEEELPIDKNDFEMFMAELAASIGVQVNELSKKVDSVEELTESLDVRKDGKLTVNGETLLDYATWFHRMTRYSDGFSVESYYELSAHDISEDSIDKESGQIVRHMNYVDLRPGTKNGDTAFVKYAEGNYVTPNDISSLLGLTPEIDVIYPFVYVWQAHLPKPADWEEKTEAYALFATKDGKRYRVSRHYSELYGTWVLTFDANGWDGTFVFSWEDTDLLTAGEFVLINDGEKVEHSKWSCYIWPTLRDVMCIEADNAEKLKNILLGFKPVNYHPVGSYIYDSNLDLWKIRTGTDWHTKFTISSEMWSWGNRLTILLDGAVPGDKLSFSFKSDSGYSISLKVINQGYGHVTVELPEEHKSYAEKDMEVSMQYWHNVERNDTFGLWSEW